MWRNFITRFERSLAVTPRYFTTTSNLNWNGPVAYVALINKTRALAATAALRNNTVSPRYESTTAGEGDTEYIVPYKAEYEKREKVQHILDTLRARFRLSHDEVNLILDDEDVAKSCRSKSLMSTLDVLTVSGVTKKSFVEYPWIITLDNDRLRDKIELLKSVRGMRDINDFVPFLRVKMPRLRKVVAAMDLEGKDVTYGNRVYYMADKLDVPASLVTKYLARRLFVLEMPLHMFKANLQHMINYNIDPISLLKDLWAFRYAPRAVETRLRRVQLAKKDKIMPWMVRCTEPILQKSLKLATDELEVLDSKSSVAEYIGERLGFSPEAAQTIMNKHPQVNRVRVPKIKEVLDYLMIEENFTRHEIAQVPRVLCHSLKTTKQRIEELKKINCRPTSLVIVCRSRREYDKFVNAWMQTYYKLKTAEQNEDENQ